MVESCTPETTSKVTGVPAHLIAEAARRYATSGGSMAVHGLGMTEHRWGSHGVMALVNLALATGNIGKPGTGINPLRGQNNVQGACDVGSLPTYFAGYQPFDNPELVAAHLAITGRPLPTTRGMKTPDMWDAALAGTLKSLWIIGYDVAQTDPNLKKVHAALKNLEFLIVQDLFLSETAKLAHLVIPGADVYKRQPRNCGDFLYCCFSPENVQAIRSSFVKRISFLLIGFSRPLRVLPSGTHSNTNT